MIIFGYFIYFPIVSLTMFTLGIFNIILKYINRDIANIFSHFIFFLIAITYLSSLLSTITLIILQLINIKFQSNKIKKINKFLFIGFYVFILMFVIGSLIMLLFFK